MAACGYEIHHGQTAQHPAMAAKGDMAREVMPGIAWQNPARQCAGRCYLLVCSRTPPLPHLFGAQAPTLDNCVFDGAWQRRGPALRPGVLDAADRVKYCRFTVYDPALRCQLPQGGSQNSSGVVAACAYCSHCLRRCPASRLAPRCWLSRSKGNRRTGEGGATPYRIA